MHANAIECPREKAMQHLDVMCCSVRAPDVLIPV